MLGCLACRHDPHFGLTMSVVPLHLLVIKMYHRLISSLDVPRKNREVIRYTDGLRRANGEPGLGKVTRVVEKSNEGLTKSA